MSESCALRRLNTVLWIPKDFDGTPAERLVVFRDLLEIARDEIMTLREALQQIAEMPLRPDVTEYTQLAYAKVIATRALKDKNHA